MTLPITISPRTLFKNGRILKDTICLLDAIEGREQLTLTLMRIATDFGNKFLTLIDFSIFNSKPYGYELYGQYSKEVESSLADKAVYNYCKKGFHQQRLANLLVQKADSVPRADIEQLHILPLKGGAGILGGLVFDIPKGFIEAKTAEHVGWFWTLLSPYLLNSAVRCRQTQFNITKREKGCISWASQGKTSWEISQILGISERTVNFHLTNIIGKTNSTNRQQAITKCVIHNII